MKVVVFLQNAWSPFWAGKKWPRKSWLRALEASRSGQRLRNMIDDYDLCEETTEAVSATSDGVEPPDFEHIKRVLETRKPEIVVACGKQAEKSLMKLWEGKLLAVPHPASRLLTNELYKEARRFIEEGFEGQVALRQTKEGFYLEKLS